MHEQSDLDLAQVPRRFWTPQMVVVAQAQGQFETAINMADALIEEAPLDKRPELEALASEARMGYTKMTRMAQLAKRKKVLEHCLKKAIAYKKTSPLEQ